MKISLSVICGACAPLTIILVSFSLQMQRLSRVRGLTGAPVSSCVGKKLVSFASTIHSDLSDELTTSVRRTPRYYGHFFSVRQNSHTFPYKKKTVDAGSPITTAKGHILHEIPNSKISCNLLPLKRPLVRNLEN